MELFGYLASVLMGLSLGMVGSGGSILTVPILVYLFKIDPVLAASYSLFVVGFTALVGGIFYYKRGEVDLKAGLIFAIPSFFGIYITRAYVMPRLPNQIFTIGSLVVTKPLLIMIVFSILMLLASISMITSKGATSSIVEKTLRKKILISVEGFIVGCIAGFVGAGGGFLIIPSLIFLIGMPMRIAVGTSLFIIAANSSFGFIGDIQRQVDIDWKLLLSVATIAIFGLFLGITLSKKVPEKILKKSFGYFVLAMGIFVLVDQIKKL